jgi:TolB-like protein/class 3 adenylate cyclase/tetratricopeptide (TPR) repeat protein
MERKLVTIMAVDAVGYSRLVGADEEGALALFNRNRTLIEDRIAAHQGRTFGGAGDSVMAEFPSPVEALRSAMDIQRDIEADSKDLPPEQRMLFRIGLNLGDVVVRDENLHGDAVNIAARLEAMAAPGGVCLSESIYNQVKHLPGLKFANLGTHRLKNIASPVRAYGLQGPNIGGYAKGSGRRPWLLLPPFFIAAALLFAMTPIATVLWNHDVSDSMAQASIAVLPLENLSGDATQEYFSDGLTNDITTDLSKFSNLFVVASNSSFMYKNKPSKVQDIGRTLGVRYLLEGTVLKTPQRVRINAQLIDSETGRHVWAERYDRPIDDVFAVQDEVIKNIVIALAVKVDDAEKQRAGRKETSDMNAYDYYLRGKAVIADPNKITREGNEEARALFQQAIDLDPEFARAYGEMSYLFVREYQNGWSEDGAESLRKAEALALKALDLVDDYDSRWGLAMVYSNQGEAEKAFAQYEIARSQNENDADLAAEMGEALMYAGEHERAIAQILGAIKHNPEVPYWYWWNLGRAYYMAKQYQEAIDAIAKIAEPPNDTLLITAASKAQLGDLKSAQSDMAKFSKNDPDWSIAKSAEYYYRNDADRQHWLDGLRKAGLKEK